MTYANGWARPDPTPPTVNPADGAHPAHGAAPAVDPELRLLAEASAELDEVEALLARLDDGTFDRCQVCGQPIGHDRLMADPLVQACPAHT